MPRLETIPNQTGYSYTDPTSVLKVDLDGGFGKYRSTVLNSKFILNVTWSLDVFEYVYFRAFYNENVSSGGNPFQLFLLFDDGNNLTDHECRFVPGSVKLIKQSGFLYEVGAALEVKPINNWPDIVAIYNAFGDSCLQYLDKFDVVINTELPGDIL